MTVMLGDHTGCLGWPLTVTGTGQYDIGLRTDSQSVAPLQHAPSVDIVTLR